MRWSGGFLCRLSHTWIARRGPAMRTRLLLATEHCIYCQAEFDSAKLRPNYNVGLQICLLWKQRR
ncbi:hypothetical protein EGR_08289 [Echinococcus granulosus]|uniref:Uncharacterized protein n=1 Tax=Echinococcus granulosus TaxID=6210 RepID=W6U6H9_ECHGR|nr:hypothetical protein EGR_08289 [Echinococcus granulosus]EUB56820.1 hypothetical protein EGR_08289 [Echinococcus granulosus]